MPYEEWRVEENGLVILRKVALKRKQEQKNESTLSIWMTTALENNKYDIIFTAKVKWTLKVFLNNAPENSVSWHPLIGNGRKRTLKREQLTS